MPCPPQVWFQRWSATKGLGAWLRMNQNDGLIGCCWFRPCCRDEHLLPLPNLHMYFEHTHTHTHDTHTHTTHARSHTHTHTHTHTHAHTHKQTNTHKHTYTQASHAPTAWHTAGDCTRSYRQPQQSQHLHWATWLVCVCVCVAWCALRAARLCLCGCEFAHAVC